MSTRSVAVILICGFTSLLLAQAPPAPPKPGPEHKKLEYFLGKWTGESEFKGNEFVPAGKTVGTETNSVGLVGTATGTVNGNTWTWMVEDKYAGKAVKDGR